MTLSRSLMLRKPPRGKGPKAGIVTVERIDGVLWGSDSHFLLSDWEDHAPGGLGIDWHDIADGETAAWSISSTGKATGRRDGANLARLIDTARERGTVDIDRRRSPHGGHEAAIIGGADAFGRVVAIFATADDSVVVGVPLATVDALESLYPDSAGLAWHASADAPALQPVTLTRHRYSGPEVVALVMPSRLAR
jgi:hypothetical protein